LLSFDDGFDIYKYQKLAYLKAVKSRWQRRITEIIYVRNYKSSEVDVHVLP